MIENGDKRERGQREAKGGYMFFSCLGLGGRMRPKVMLHGWGRSICARAGGDDQCIEALDIAIRPGIIWPLHMCFEGICRRMCRRHWAWACSKLMCGYGGVLCLTICEHLCLWSASIIRLALMLDCFSPAGGKILFGRGPKGSKFTAGMR
jgi:hypothetical protein